MKPRKMTELSTEAFYRQAVQENESRTGGWSRLYYGTVSGVIKARKFQRAVEVGIGYGLHAKDLLLNTDLTMLTLVDPMKFYPNDGFASDVQASVPKIPGGQFDELAELIRAELAPWPSRYTWLRKESLSVTQEEIPDGSVDCVFVDGDHSYEAVKADLAFWWKKIRPGGMLLGDDYWMEEVARAVQEFASTRDLPLTFAQNPVNPSYQIFQFLKI